MKRLLLGALLMAWSASTVLASGGAFVKTDRRELRGIDRNAKRAIKEIERQIDYFLSGRAESTSAVRNIQRKVERAEEALAELQRVMPSWSRIGLYRRHLAKMKQLASGREQQKVAAADERARQKAEASASAEEATKQRFAAMDAEQAFRRDPSASLLNALIRFAKGESCPRHSAELRKDWQERVAALPKFVEDCKKSYLLHLAQRRPEVVELCRVAADKPRAKLATMTHACFSQAEKKFIELFEQRMQQLAAGTRTISAVDFATVRGEPVISGGHWKWVNQAMVAARAKPVPPNFTMPRAVLAKAQRTLARVASRVRFKRGNASHAPSSRLIRAQFAKHGYRVLKIAQFDGWHIKQQFGRPVSRSRASAALVRYGKEPFCRLIEGIATVESHAGGGRYSGLRSYVEIALSRQKPASCN
ncbi:MAG: hypothetical protein H6707_20735 [Deltaproteobacteria bacterium]|nr:hypothetical protein [Deltaproteobacteria bacterium]